MVISMLKIRRPLGRLIFNMGIAIPGKTVFLIETAPCCSHKEEKALKTESGHDANFSVNGVSRQLHHDNYFINIR